MSSPLIVDTYSFVLNKANNFIFTTQLLPNITGVKFVRVLSSNNNVILKISLLRSSFVLTSDSFIPENIDGICVPSQTTWYETNTDIITSFKASIYNSQDNTDQISIVLQFANSVFNVPNN